MYDIAHDIMKLFYLACVFTALANPGVLYCMLYHTSTCDIAYDMLLQSLYYTMLYCYTVCHIGITLGCMSISPKP